MKSGFQLSQAIAINLRNFGLACAALVVCASPALALDRRGAIPEAIPAASVPLAHGSVSTGGGIGDFDAASNGMLSAVSGPPVEVAGLMTGSNGEILAAMSSADTSLALQSDLLAIDGETITRSNMLPELLGNGKSSRFAGLTADVLRALVSSNTAINMVEASGSIHPLRMPSAVNLLSVERGTTLGGENSQPRWMRLVKPICPSLVGPVSLKAHNWADWACRLVTRPSPGRVPGSLASATLRRLSSWKVISTGLGIAAHSMPVRATPSWYALARRSMP